jgi:hypothetical protein
VHNRKYEEALAKTLDCQMPGMRIKLRNVYIEGLDAVNVKCELCALGGWYYIEIIT